VTPAEIESGAVSSLEGDRITTCDKPVCDNAATGYDAWGQWCDEHDGGSESRNHLVPRDGTAARRFICPNCRIVLRVVVSATEVRCDRCGYARTS
jgi:hypothetical protein